MESIHQVKEALVARSETTSIDELQRGGRKHVKVIKATDIAGMIQEAVERAIQSSELISQEEADRLVEQSRAEFKSVMAERHEESEATRRLEERNSELEKALEAAKGRIEQHMEETAKLQAAVEAAAANAATAAAAARPMDTNAEMMMRMMTEIAQLKAGGAPRAPPQPGADGDGGSLTAALDNISSKMNERLDQMGKKLGISSAVEADDVKFDALFNNMDDEDIESNIENMEVKKKTGTGIAGNLAKLKKLKGGGD